MIIMLIIVSGRGSSSCAGSDIIGIMIIISVIINDGLMFTFLNTPIESSRVI